MISQRSRVTAFLADIWTKLNMVVCWMRGPCAEGLRLSLVWRAGPVPTMLGAVVTGADTGPAHPATSPWSQDQLPSTQPRVSSRPKMAPGHFLSSQLILFTWSTLALSLSDCRKSHHRIGDQNSFLVTGRQLGLLCWKGRFMVSLPWLAVATPHQYSLSQLCPRTDKYSAISPRDFNDTNSDWNLDLKAGRLPPWFMTAAAGEKSSRNYHFSNAFGKR